MISDEQKTILYGFGILGVTITPTAVTENVEGGEAAFEELLDQKYIDYDGEFYSLSEAGIDLLAEISK